jgi:hypothetical protein
MTEIFSDPEKFILEHDSGEYECLNPRKEIVEVKLRKGVFMETVTYQNDGQKRVDEYDPNGILINRVFDGYWRKPTNFDF